MDIRKLTSELFVTGQINPQDMAEIASLGFRSIICNRPDGEEFLQPTQAEIAAEAAKCGLAMRYMPVHSAAIDDVQADAFDVLMTQLDKPVLAYCRSGTRCTVLWSLSQASARPLEDILQRTANAGYDLSGLLPRLERRRQG